MSVCAIICASGQEAHIMIAFDYRSLSPVIYRTLDRLIASAAVWLFLRRSVLPWGRDEAFADRGGDLPNEIMRGVGIWLAEIRANFMVDRKWLDYKAL